MFDIILILCSSIDIGTGAQRNPEFMRINPTHTLPTLDGNGFILWDSHAVSTYLISKYAGDNHELYPSNIEKRAQVDQFLHFNGRTLFPRFFTICYGRILAWNA